jgi:tetratricopeptide (TPR) repeat protein
VTFEVTPSCPPHPLAHQPRLIQKWAMRIEAEELAALTHLTRRALEGLPDAPNAPTRPARDIVEAHRVHPPTDLPAWQALAWAFGLLVEPLHHQGQGRLALGLASAAVLITQRALEVDPAQHPALERALSVQAAQHERLGEAEAASALRQQVAGDPEPSPLPPPSETKAEAPPVQPGSTPPVDPQSTPRAPTALQAVEAVLELAIAASQAGLHEDACASGAKVIQWMQHQAKTSPKVARRLARRLPDWARILEAADRPEQQEAALLECVDRLRQWPQDAFFRSAILVSLGHMYWQQGRPQAGLPWMAESVEAARIAADQTPDLRVELARTLVAHGQFLLLNQRITEAIRPFSEALTIYRDLAAGAPEHTDELARCLDCLASVHMHRFDHRALAPVLVEVVAYRRRQAEHNPTLTLQLWADLSILGQSLRVVDDVPGSLAAYQELVDRVRPRAEVDPTHLAELVDGLHEVAVTHMLLDQHEVARPILEEALARFAECDPPPTVSRWLLHFEAGGMYRVLEQFERSLEHFETARAAAEDHTQQAEAARGISLVLSDLERDDDACRVMGEALEAFWLAAQEEPDRVDALREAMADYLEIEPNPSAEVLARARLLGVKG